MQKLSVCGTFDLHSQIRYLLVDHDNSSGFVNLSYTLIGPNSVEHGLATPGNHSTYTISFQARNLGSQILALYLNGQQLPNSPFLVIIEQGVCYNSSGRVMDADGNCVCPPGTTLEISKSCVGVTTFLLAVIIPFAVCCILVVVFALRRKTELPIDADLWLIKECEICYPEPLEKLGIGCRSDVLRAEYRGTPVAVKHFKFEGDKPLILPNIQAPISPTDSQQWSMLAELCHQATPLSFNQAQSSKRKLSLTNSATTNVSSATFSSRETTISAVSMAKLHSDVKTLVRLAHPYLVTVIGAVLSEALPSRPICIVMEIMDLGSLWDLLHNEMYPISGKHALRFLQDVTKGMQFLHDESPPCLHGDLKSSNILIDRNFCAKISDFGLHFNRSSGYWAAPECLQGQPNSLMADVYAFGVVVYEVLTRKVPYEGEDLERIYEEVSRGELRLELPAGCSAEVSVLMNECLHLSPSKRPPFAELSRRLHAMDVSQMTSPAFNQVDGEAAESSASARKNESMRIMHNLFPADVAEALLRGERVPPQRKEMVTMYFSDIVGFTTLSAAMAPEKVSSPLCSYAYIDDLYS